MPWAGGMWSMGLLLWAIGPHSWPMRSRLQHTPPRSVWPQEYFATTQPKLREYKPCHLANSMLALKKLGCKVRRKGRQVGGAGC